MTHSPNGASPTEPPIRPRDDQNSRAIAMAATGGEWLRSGVRRKIEGSDTHSIIAEDAGKDGKGEIIASVWYNPKTHEGFSDAAFIAHFNPVRVLSMLEEIERLRGALEEIETCAFVASDGYWNGGKNPIRIARDALSNPLGEGLEASVADRARALRGAHTDAAEVGKGGGS